VQYVIAALRLRIYRREASSCIIELFRRCQVTPKTPRGFSPTARGLTLCLVAFAYIGPRLFQSGLFEF
jgi:hypothetical protein